MLVHFSSDPFLFERGAVRRMIRTGSGVGSARPHVLRALSTSAPYRRVVHRTERLCRPVMRFVFCAKDLLHIDRLFRARSAPIVGFGVRQSRLSPVVRPSCRRFAGLRRLLPNCADPRPASPDHHRAVHSKCVQKPDLRACFALRSASQVSWSTWPFQSAMSPASPAHSRTERAAWR